MKNLVEEFIGKRTLSPDMELNEPLHKAIYCLEKSHELISNLVFEHRHKLANKVPWRPLHDIYQRNYEYCCGALSCFLLVQLQSSEALCRTAVEGAVNLHYMSLGDSMGKEIAYFKNHLKTEQKQNRNWKKSIDKSDYPPEAKERHLEGINQKDEILNLYDDMLRQSLAFEGVDYDSSNLRWPSIFDRFREVGDEVGYRTVYAALCSQAHSDAEDILNQILSRVVKVEGSSRTQLEEARKVEQYRFSLYMILTTIKYHIYASIMYIGKFEISVPSELIDLHKELVESLLTMDQSHEQVLSEIISEI
jgi:hypothetical protein